MTIGNPDEGLQVWRQCENNNRMIALQRDPPRQAEGAVELAFFGSSAFRVTSPGGLSVMLDPWRNHPSGKWDWYRGEFPAVEVDVGVSTHAHFDHDALHRLRAHVLIDRLIGTWSFGDLTLHGIADKHVSDSSHSLYDWCRMTRLLYGIDPRPPDNPRSFDNSLIVVETGGLRILHWGDNRPDPPDEVWAMLGRIDVALLPVDDSRHVLSHEQADAIAERLGARVVVPHHYFIWDLMQRASTLQPADEWVARHDSTTTDGAVVSLRRDELPAGGSPRVLHFGDHVAFEKPPRAEPLD